MLSSLVMGGPQYQKTGIWESEGYSDASKQLRNLFVFIFLIIYFLTKIVNHAMYHPETSSINLSAWEILLQVLK